jgi:hypothetical protein
MVYQPLIHDLRPRLCCDIAMQVHLQFTRNLQVSLRRRITHQIKQIDSAATGNRHQPIGLCRLTLRLQRGQMRPNQRPDYLQMAQLFGPKIQQQVPPSQIVYAIPSLNRVLHRRRQFAIRAAKLLQQHISEPDIRLTDIYRVRQLLIMVLHK